jgi:hypothetical protein
MYLEEALKRQRRLSSKHQLQTTKTSYRISSKKKKGHPSTLQTLRCPQTER